MRLRDILEGKTEWESKGEKEIHTVTTCPVWVIVWNWEAGRGAWIGKGGSEQGERWLSQLGHVDFEVLMDIKAVFNKWKIFMLQYLLFEKVLSPPLDYLFYWYVCLFIYLFILQIFVKYLLCVKRNPILTVVLFYSAFGLVVIQTIPIQPIFMFEMIFFIWYSFILRGEF